MTFLLLRTLLEDSYLALSTHNQIQFIFKRRPGIHGRKPKIMHPVEEPGPHVSSVYINGFHDDYRKSIPEFPYIDDAESDSVPPEPPPRGWAFVRANLHEIVKSDRTARLLAEKEKSVKLTAEAYHAGSRGLQQQIDDAIPNRPSDMSRMQRAIPFLPLPLAVICSLANVVIPGLGTLLSGLFGLCFGTCKYCAGGQARIRAMAVNFVVAICQFFTVTFFLIGWLWSLSWSGIIVAQSVEYTKVTTKLKKRKVFVAAMEGLGMQNPSTMKAKKRLFKMIGD